MADPWLELTVTRPSLRSPRPCALTLNPALPAPPPPPSPIANLPQELHDAIVDHCHADIPSLASCSAVCRAWLPASRYHIFASVLLHPRNVAGFFLLIRSPFCTFRPYLTALAVEQGPILSGPAASCEEFWFNYGFMSLAGFPSVRFLHITHLGLLDRDISTRLTASLRTNFSAVTDLGIKAARFSSFSQLASVIAAFPNIERLSLDGLYVKSRSIPQPDATPPLLHLKTLVLTETCVTGILNWLLAQRQLPPITTLHLTWRDSSKQPAVLNDFCTRLGSNLEHLHLDNVVAIDLSQNMALRSLHIIRPDRLILGSDWITPLISSVSSREMESLMIETDNLITDINSVHWSSLDYTLSKPHFQTLQTIEVRTTSTSSELLQKKLPNCESRRLLRFPGVSAVPLPFLDFLQPIGKPPAARPSASSPILGEEHAWSSFSIMACYASFTIAQYLLLSVI